MAETVNTNQFKNGMDIELDGGVWRIVEFQHVKPGKGGAFVRTKLKALESGAVVDRTFRAGEKFPRIRTETKDMPMHGEEHVQRPAGALDVAVERLPEALLFVLGNKRVDDDDRLLELRVDGRDLRPPVLGVVPLGVHSRPPPQPRAQLLYVHPQNLTPAGR